MKIINFLMKIMSFLLPKKYYWFFLAGLFSCLYLSLDLVGYLNDLIFCLILLILVLATIYYYRRLGVERFCPIVAYAVFALLTVAHRLWAELSLFSLGLAIALCFDAIFLCDFIVKKIVKKKKEEEQIKMN